MSTCCFRMLETVVIEIIAGTPCAVTITLRGIGGDGKIVHSA